MREVKTLGDTANCEVGEDSGDRGSIVERVLSETGVVAGQGSRSAFRDSGTIGKGVGVVIGGGGAVIRCLRVCHL